MDTERKLRAAASPPSWSLKARNLPTPLSRQIREPATGGKEREREGGRKGRRKEERNGTAGSVSEPYISAGTNCPIIHSVRQLRCSPLIHRCYFPPSSPSSSFPPSLFSLLSFFPSFFPRRERVRARRTYIWLLPRRCLSSRLCFSPSSSFVFQIRLFFSRSKFRYPIWI